MFFKCSRLQQLQHTPNEAWGGIYIAQPLKLTVGGKLTEKLVTPVNPMLLLWPSSVQQVKVIYPLEKLAVSSTSN